MNYADESKIHWACLIITVGMFVNGGAIAGFIAAGIVLLYIAFETNRWAIVETEELEKEIADLHQFMRSAEADFFSKGIYERVNNITKQARKTIRIEITLSILCFIISACVYLYDIIGLHIGGGAG